jgi:O-antigen/teichoic acid export membrane protein
MPSMMAAGTLGRLNESTVPALNELYGRGEVERVRQAFSRITRLQLLFGFPLALGVLLFNHDLITTWVGSGQYAGLLLTASLAVYCLFSGLVGIAIRFAYVFGWMRVLASTSILQGLANFGLGLFLGRRIGLGGIALALAIVLLPQLAILLFMIGKFLQINVARLLARCTIRSVIPLAVASLGSLLAHSVVQIHVHHFGAFLGETLPFVALYFPLAYFFYMHDQDRNDAKRFFSAAIGRSRIWGARLSRTVNTR